MSKWIAGFRSSAVGLWILLLGGADVNTATAAEVWAVVGKMTASAADVEVTLFFEFRTDGETYLEGLIVDTVGGVASVTFAQFGEDGTVLRFESESSTFRSAYDLESGTAVNAFGLGLVLGLEGIEQAVTPPAIRSDVRLAIRHAAPTVELRWTAVVGLPYRIEFSPDLGGSWATVATVTGDSSDQRWTDPAGTTDPQGFYRLGLPVVINGVALDDEQLSEIDDLYGVRPRSGSYWYDPVSGLYGVIGYPAFGFMYSGHDFGELPRQASLGNTGVLINGRELSISEYWVWSLILGAWIQPGAYWLDDEGRAGEEGNPLPTVNLAQGGEENSYSGQGSGGDNFWSTRFSAGNSDNNNQRGYVSVPGYGPIGYGF